VAARQRIWTHSANAAADTSIQLNGNSVQLKNRRFVKEELNRIGLRFKRMAVVLLLQAQLCKSKHLSNVATPLVQEVLDLIKRAAEMTRACKGVKLNAQDRWMDAVIFFNDEVIAEKPIWNLLTEQYDPKLMKELAREWADHHEEW
jgi:hypothetical protein